MTPSPRFWLTAQLIVASTLVVGAWGLAAVSIFGFAFNPAALGRSLSDGTPTWPFQVSAVLVLLLIGALCLKFRRLVARRLTQPMQPMRPMQPMQPIRPPRHKAPRGARRADNAHPRPPRLHSSTISPRAQRFVLGSLLLASAALLAGMIGEWRGPEPEGLGGLGTLLALATLGGAFAVGVALTHHIQVRRIEAADDPETRPGDGRPVLALIWWPITVVAIGGALFMAGVGALQGVSVGSGLPTGMCLVVGVFGFISLPVVVSESYAEFHKRGVRGFWRAARATEWGDGLP